MGEEEIKIVEKRTEAAKEAGTAVVAERHTEKRAAAAASGAVLAVVMMAVAAAAAHAEKVGYKRGAAVVGARAGAGAGS